MIGKPRACIEEREPIEWSNFWFDNANTKSSKRILLVGDSTLRCVRGPLSRLINCPVDLFATSSCLHDFLYIKQIDLFFSLNNYRYDAIFVQYGHHSQIAIGGGEYKEEDFILYEKEFEILIRFLQQFSDRIIVESMFYNVIEKKKRWYNRKRRWYNTLFLKDVYDKKVNKNKFRKNKIMECVAKNLNVKFLDINDYMLNEGKKFVHEDIIHYEDSGNKFIAKKMHEILCNILDD